MAVRDEGGGKGWCHPRKGGEEDFPGHIQGNNATREHGHCPASTRQPSPRKLRPLPYGPNSRTLLPPDPSPPSYSPSLASFPFRLWRPTPSTYPPLSRSPTPLGSPSLASPAARLDPSPLTSPQRLLVAEESDPWLLGAHAPLIPSAGGWSLISPPPPLPPPPWRPWVTVSASPDPLLPQH